MSVLAPAPASRLGPGEERTGKAPTEPQRPESARVDLGQREARELVVGDPAGQSLGASADEIGRGAAQHEKAGRATRAVGQHPEHGEEIRSALELVDDHETSQRPQRERRVSQAGQVGWILEVETGHRPLPSLCQRTGQRGLADLARAHHPHHGELAEERGKPPEMVDPLDHAENVPWNVGVRHRDFTAPTVDPPPFPPGMKLVAGASCASRCARDR